jgi:hypothetical protein
MRKLIYSIALTAIILSSCGGSGEETLESKKIDTKDVQGTIEAGDVSIGTTNLHNNDGEFEVPNVKISDQCRLTIVPTQKTFEDEWNLIQSNATSFDGTLKEIEKKDGAVLYHEKSEFMEKVTEGYNFLVMIKGEGKNYVIKGEGENPFAPITSKEDAEKAFKIAQTFKPE